MNQVASQDIFQGQLFVGMVVSLLNIGLHALMMAAVSRVVLFGEDRTGTWGPGSRRVGIMMMAVSILMMAHFVEVIVWGWTYYLTDAVNDHRDDFYFAFVNYTTLGYGDVLPIHQWRMLGPIAAMNGILLFGWSTAVIYDILRNIDVAVPSPVASGSPPGPADRD